MRSYSTHFCSSKVKKIQKKRSKADFYMHMNDKWKMKRHLHLCNIHSKEIVKKDKIAINLTLYLQTYIPSYILHTSYINNY